MLSAPKDTPSFPPGTLSLKTRHRRSCADTASYPRCTMLTHPGRFPAVWRRNRWHFIFLRATAHPEAGASCPPLPTENSFLWRPLGIHTASCHRHPEHGVCEGISSRVWHYLSCLTAGKGAVSHCTLSIRAFHHVPFGNCGRASQVYSETPHAQGKLWAT